MAAVAGGSPWAGFGFERVEAIGGSLGVLRGRVQGAPRGKIGAGPWSAKVCPIQLWKRPKTGRNLGLHGPRPLVPRPIRLRSDGAEHAAAPPAGAGGQAGPRFPGPGRKRLRLRQGSAPRDRCGVARPPESGPQRVGTDRLRLPVHRGPGDAPSGRHLRRPAARGRRPAAVGQAPESSAGGAAGGLQRPEALAGDPDVGPGLDWRAVRAGGQLPLG